MRVHRVICYLVERQEEVLEDKDEEEEESEVDEKIKRTLNSCMRHGDDHGME